MQVDAFLGAFVDFDLVGGHLVAAFQADHVDFFIAAEAQGGAGHVVGYLLARHVGPAPAERRHVVGHIAAADHDDALAQRQRRALVEGAQEIHAVEHVSASAPGSGSLRPLGSPMPRKMAL